MSSVPPRLRCRRRGTRPSSLFGGGCYRQLERERAPPPGAPVGPNPPPRARRPPPPTRPPPPASLPAQLLPPCASTTERAIASPIPVPPSSRERDSSTR